MSKHKPYGMMTPCENCPFRSDVQPYIHPTRVREIERSLIRSEFPCHKTTTHDEEGEQVRSGEEMHCAGALILMEKEGRSSQMMRISERLGMYDSRKLDMGAPVYDSFDAMFEAHRAAERKTVTKAKKVQKDSAATRRRS
jgi:hypothetical protein